MKKIQKKLALIILAILLVAFIMPTQVLCTNDDLQIIKTETEDYIIYVKGLETQEFNFAIVQNLKSVEDDIDYLMSEQDDGKNQVILITKEKYEEIKEKDNYLFVKNNDNIIVNGEKIDFKKAITIENIKNIENITKNIQTELVKNINQKEEIIDGVKNTVTIGGLKIEENSNSKYYYSITKLPKEKYNTLKELAEKISFSNEKLDTFTKLELIRQFYEIYNELKSEQNWNEVVDSIVMQPEDSENGEEYVVYLKEVNKNEENYDVKFMTSYREDKEEKLPERTETKVVKETTKLPITGDNIVLFIILAIVIVAIVIVFVRMKKLQKEDKR